MKFIWLLKVGSSCWSVPYKSPTYFFYRRQHREISLFEREFQRSPEQDTVAVVIRKFEDTGSTEDTRKSSICTDENQSVLSLRLNTSKKDLHTLQLHKPACILTIFESSKETSFLNPFQKQWGLRSLTATGQNSRYVKNWIPETQTGTMNKWYAFFWTF